MKKNTYFALLLLMIGIHSAIRAGDLTPDQEPVKEDLQETLSHADSPVHPSGSITLQTLKAIGLRCALKASGLSVGMNIAFKYATCKNKGKLAQALLRWGANVNLPNLRKNTPLIEAASSGNTEIARILLDAQAEVNKRGHEGNTALQEAALNGHTEIVRMLLNANADNDIPSITGWTPLMLAYHRSHSEIVRMLLDAHADIDSIRTDQGTLLMDAIHKKDIPLIRFLIEKNVELNNQYQQRTPLTYAITFEQNELTNLLIEAHADVNIPDGEGDTPLLLAVMYRNNHLIHSLIRAHADLNAQNNQGVSALHCAALLNNDVDLIKTLLDAGANVNAVSIKTGKSILEELVEAYAPHPMWPDYMSIIQSILDFSPQVDYAKTLAFAHEQGLTDVIALLEAYSDKHSEELMVKPAVN